MPVFLGGDVGNIGNVGGRNKPSSPLFLPIPAICRVRKDGDGKHALELPTARIESRMVESKHPVSV